MADPRVERLARQILEALSDPKVCGKGADVLRKQIKRELQKAGRDNPGITAALADRESRRIAGRVEDLCTGLPPTVRAAGVVVAAAGAVYGISQMTEREIRDAIAKTNVDVLDTRIMVDGLPVHLSLSTTLAPLVGERATFDAELKWRKELFGYQGTASLFAKDLGRDPRFGGKWTTKFGGGSAEVGAHNGGGGTIYFKATKEF